MKSLALYSEVISLTLNLHRYMIGYRMRHKKVDLKEIEKGIEISEETIENEKQIHCGHWSISIAPGI